MLNWPTGILLSVLLSPAILGLLRIGFRASFIMADNVSGFSFSLDYAAFFLVIFSFATCWKWIYDAAFRLHRKYYPEQDRHSFWQVAILFPLFPLAIGIVMFQLLPEQESFEYYWVWVLSVISWLLMCLLASVRITWLLGELEGKRRYFRWFLSLLTWPVGIWWIQPILREAWNREIEKTDVDHFLA